MTLPKIKDTTSDFDRKSQISSKTAKIVNDQTNQIRKDFFRC